MFISTTISLSLRKMENTQSTPERNNNPLSNEGSPVYNFIKTLSPLKPVKPVHVTPTFNSLSFSSPPSVFTSPHINSHKNSSRLLRRHNLMDTSEPVNRIYSCEEAPTTDSSHAFHDSNEQQQNTDQRISEYTRFLFKLPEALQHIPGSHGYGPLLYGDAANPFFQLPLPAGVQEGPKKDSVEGDMHHIEERGNLVTDDSDQLHFSSPNVTMSKYMGPSLLPQPSTNNGGRMQTVNLAASGSEYDIEYHPTGPITCQTQNNLANVAVMTSNPSEQMYDELIYATHPGMRRCLDYGMASVQWKNSGGNSNIRCVMPGIGVHLNELATLEDYKSLTSGMMPSQMQPNLPSSIYSMLISSRQERHLSLVPTSMEKDLEPSENEVQPAKDCTESPVCTADEDFHQNIPKKKRRKFEPGSEGESCKRCHCKKSKCLKLYCECFAAGVYCTEPCTCQNCFNKHIHEDIVTRARKQIQSRNPLAFAPKVIRSSDSTPEIGDDPNKTPASARHKRGCNCKKSSCLKKYCECYQGGVGCSISCRCEGCKNSYGRKDGSAPTEIEAEPEEETKAHGKSVVGEAPKTRIQNEDQSDCALPTTPLRLSRRLLPLPFSSKENPSGSFIGTISASGLIASQELGKSNAVQSQAKSEEPFQTVPDDNDSSNTCIKTSSPNGKRISSPNTRSGSSRKLILQSIPSFPSLAPPQ